VSPELSRAGYVANVSTFLATLSPLAIRNTNRQTLKKRRSSLLNDNDLGEFFLFFIHQQLIPARSFLPGEHRPIGDTFALRSMYLINDGDFMGKGWPLGTFPKRCDGRGAKEETKNAGIMQGKRCPRAVCSPVAYPLACVYRN